MKLHFVGKLAFSKRAPAITQRANFGHFSCHFVALKIFPCQFFMSCIVKSGRKKMVHKNIKDNKKDN